MTSDSVIQSKIPANSVNFDFTENLPPGILANSFKFRITENAPSKSPANSF